MIPNSVPSSLTGALSQLRLQQFEPNANQRRRSDEPVNHPVPAARQGHKRTSSYESTSSTNFAPNPGGDFPLDKQKSFSDNSILDDATPTPSRTISSSYSSSTPDSGIDNEFAHMALEPGLRPTQPDPSNEASMEIFRQHRQMAQHVFRMQTEIELLKARKKELLAIDEAQVCPDIFSEQEALEKERKDLILLKNNLGERLFTLKKKKRQKEAENDGDWVLVDSSSTAI